MCEVECPYGTMPACGAPDRFCDFGHEPNVNGLLYYRLAQQKQAQAEDRAVGGIAEISNEGF